MLFSFPAGTKMFQFPAFAHLYDVVDIWSTGLPHSEISGSRVICTSPELVAACHVLLRLREPRHPPVALFFFFLFYERSYFSGLIQTLRSKFVRVVFCCVFLPAQRTVGKTRLNLLYFNFFPQYVKDRGYCDI